MTIDTGIAAAPSSRPASSGLQPAFADPVRGAQSTFRAALAALAHPGRIRTLGAEQACGVPDGLSPAMTALLLALADADAPLWLPAAADDGIRRFLRFHNACAFADAPAHATFAAVPAGHATPKLADCAQGDPAYPDRSTTLLIEVDALGEGDAVTLRGPGIENEQALAVNGLPDGFWTQWRVSHERFPLGVDVLLVCGHTLCGLPRTTVVEN
ncbi:phosphonate C-P lyase system protein PhnH [Burkholderia oklahomensis]|uniref:phosphonate C-P lyase system protein PhnH n=1 Tax=Burkholderia oklahomensis TaxID=342113 RepID=UPI002656ED15|nr:phosphonate C-P lyase system protein PhnH [Burkholderia oklahomensis]MDN7673409.1 phosphonate C-P lyase system protein PhnH [Burkholderia oklahomensis]